MPEKRKEAQWLPSPVQMEKRPPAPVVRAGDRFSLVRKAKDPGCVSTATQVSEHDSPKPTLKSGSLPTLFQIQAGSDGDTNFGVTPLAASLIRTSDDNAHSNLRQIEQTLGEFDGHSDATVRGRIAWERPAMECNPRPGNPLHEGHVPVLIEVGIVLSLLLDHGINAGRRLIPLAAAGDRRPHDPAVRIVDRNPLVAERDDGHDWPSGGPGLNELDASLGVRLGICGPHHGAEE